MNKLWVLGPLGSPPPWRHEKLLYGLNFSTEPVYRATRLQKLVFVIIVNHQHNHRPPASSPSPSLSLSELANGRLAMMAFVGMVLRDGRTGSAWGDLAVLYGIPAALHCIALAMRTTSGQIHGCSTLIHLVP